MSELNRFDRRDVVLAHKGVSWRLWTIEMPFTGPVAGVLTPTPEPARGGVPEHMSAIFTKRPVFKKTVSLAALRRAAGKVDWDDNQRPMFRQIAGVSFNMKLVGRCLAAVDAGVSKVRIEVAKPMTKGLASTLRIVAPDWIAIVASGKDASPPLPLAEPS